MPGVPRFTWVEEGVAIRWVDVDRGRDLELDWSAGDSEYRVADDPAYFAVEVVGGDELVVAGWRESETSYGGTIVEQGQYDDGASFAPWVLALGDGPGVYTLIGVMMGLAAIRHFGKALFPWL